MTCTTSGLVSFPRPGVISEHLLWFQTVGRRTVAAQVAGGVRRVASRRVPLPLLALGE
jgi:hypothetical protein